MGALTSDPKPIARLKNHRFKKLEAELLRPVPKAPKERGPIEVALNLVLRSEDEGGERARRMVSEVNLTVTGLAAPDDDKAEPIFRIHVVAQGAYEVDAGVPREALEDDAFSKKCAAPIYTLAAGEVATLATKLELPRLRIPLTLANVEGERTSAAPGKGKRGPRALSTRS